MDVGSCVYADPVGWGMFPHCLIAFGAKSGILGVTANPKDQYLLWDTEG